MKSWTIKIFLMLSMSSALIYCILFLFHEKGTTSRIRDISSSNNNNNNMQYRLRKGKKPDTQPLQQPKRGKDAKQGSQLKPINRMKDSSHGQHSHHAADIKSDKKSDGKILTGLQTDNKGKKLATKDGELLNGLKHVSETFEDDDDEADTKSDFLAGSHIVSNLLRQFSSSDDGGDVDSNKNETQKKYLIFVCNRGRSCGGWGDRQRGLTGMYSLALATGRTFGVIMTIPCNITNIYVPNDVNWIIPESRLKGLTSITLDDMNSKLALTKKLRTLDFNAEYPQQVVYIRTNADYILGVAYNPLYREKIPIWARGSRATFFAIAWQTLMKPHPHLRQRLRDFNQRIDFQGRQQPLVCAHVRVGRSSTIKSDTTIRCNISSLPVLWDFLDQWVQNGSHVFLATDSMEVRNLTRQRFGNKMYDSGGSIIHVDQQSRLPNACQGFESALLDQLILTQCDLLVTSHSIFSQRASYLRGSSEHLYSFLKGKMRQYKLP